MPIEMITYEGSNQVLVHKHDIRDFNYGAQLVVDDSQEAIFYKDGQALDLFGGGRYQLNADNIPLLRRIYERFTQSKTIFTCQVYYINKVVSQELMWGTNTAIQMMDPTYDIPIHVKSYGSYKIQINDARKFLLKTVGTLDQFTTEVLQDYFRMEMISHIKSTLTKAVRIQKISILDINAYLIELAQALKETLGSIFDDYGIALLQVSIASIKADHDDLHVLKDAKNNAMRRKTEGYSYHEERSFDTLEKAASNPGAGTTMGAGLGLGLGVSLGKGFGETFDQTIQTTKPSTTPCSACQKPMPRDSLFCLHCGQSQHRLCTACGKVLTAEARFCGHCGTSSTPVKHCLTCQKTVDLKSVFCEHCGTKL